MFLATTLLQNRIRKITVQQEWPARLSVTLLLTALAARLVFLVAGARTHAAPQAMATLLVAVIFSWAVFGLVTGHDLSWRISASAYRSLPLSFPRIFLTTWLLSYLSGPMLAIAVLMAALMKGIHLEIPWITAVLTAIVLAATQKGFIFAARNLLRMRRALSLTLTVVTGLSVSCYSLLLCQFRYGKRGLPSGQGWIFAGAGCFCVLFSWLAFAHEKALLRSGQAGSLERASGHRLLFRYLATGSESSLFARISMLSWLRSRNALALYLWACVYGFCYPYFTHMVGKGGYLLFGWMVLVFHSYLRGNLLGPEHAGLAAFALSRERLNSFVQAKINTFTMLQIIMLVAVFAAAACKGRTSIGDTADWMFCLQALVLLLLGGEAVGVGFSLWTPSAIHREAYYSGSMTPGAIILPFAQLAVLVGYYILFWKSRHVVSSGHAVLFLSVVPIAALLLRFGFLKNGLPEIVVRCRTQLLDIFSAG